MDKWSKFNKVYLLRIFRQCNQQHIRNSMNLLHQRKFRRFRMDWMRTHQYL